MKLFLWAVVVGNEAFFNGVSVLFQNMELTRSDNMSKVLYYVGEPCTLLEVESDTGFAQPREDHVNVLDVSFCRCREDDDII